MAFALAARSSWRVAATSSSSSTSAVSTISPSRTCTARTVPLAGLARFMIRPAAMRPATEVTSRIGRVPTRHVLGCACASSSSPAAKPACTPSSPMSLLHAHAPRPPNTASTIAAAIARATLGLAQRRGERHVALLDRAVRVLQLLELGLNLLRERELRRPATRRLR